MPEITTSPVVYNPGEVWTPALPFTDLHDAVAIWRAEVDNDGKVFAAEQDVANELAGLSRQAIPGIDQSCHNYTAGYAIDKKVGDCRAHTGVSIGAAVRERLDTLVSWTFNHASMIWVAEREVWEINAFSKKAQEYYKDDTPSSRASAHHLMRWLVSRGRGAYIEHGPLYSAQVEAETEAGPVMKATLVPNPLGLSEVAYPPEADEGISVVLPPDQGIAYLTAMGDIVRYKHESGKLDRLDQVRDSIRPLVPKGTQL